MLTNVHVKNFALIEESNIDLREGFNILTGETGAGKSIIIGSINYCLGAKADRDVIRQGAEYALVELTFNVENNILAQEIRNKDYPIEEDNSLILTRRITPTKSIFKINGETVTARAMKELASYLIDIHGQHEHQSLLSSGKQKELLDGFAGEKLAERKAAIADIYDEIKKVKSEIEEYSMDSQKREREISLAEYEVEEIEGANLRPGEAQELSAAHARMQNSRKITDALGKASMYIGGDKAALDAVGYALREAETVSEYDDSLSDIASHLSDAEQVLRSAYRELQDYIEDMDFPQEECERIEQRLDVINRLMLKYGNDIEAINEYCEKRKEELEKLREGAAYLEGLNIKLDKLRKQYEKNAQEIHELRAKQAVILSGEICEALQDMNFLKVDFEIDVCKSDNEGRDGYDEVNFNISLNPGENKKPISQVASGGELSRIMLSLKTVLASRDNIETMIFDEIDAGISGVTAWQVAKKMGRLSGSRQLICITHLPQIAAMADTHFMISKKEKDGATVTDISILDSEGKKAEVARLLGSEKLTEAALKNAEELIAQANGEKQ